MKDPLTTGDCARLSGLSQLTIIRQCDAGDLKYWLVPGSKHRRIARTEFIKWLDKNKIPLLKD